VTPAGARRAVFLDVDGTYSVDGGVPRAHEEAVRAARRNGHLVFLATGRPLSLLTSELLGVGFDGLVLGAGCHVVVGDTVLADRTFPPDLAARVLSVLDAHDVAYVLESSDGMFGRPGVEARLRHVIDTQLRPIGIEHGGAHEVLEALVVRADLAECSFGKVIYFDSAVTGDVLAAGIGDEAYVERSSIPGMGDSAGEIAMAGVDKSVGLRAVVEHLGLRREDVVAVGDGPNDVGMLEYAGLGVAVAGSDPTALAVADRVTPGPREDGVATLFADLGLV
jgi:Cof subfamily protein (haloacid dehalogenase superfamily)